MLTFFPPPFLCFCLPCHIAFIFVYTLLLCVHVYITLRPFHFCVGFCMVTHVAVSPFRIIIIIIIIIIIHNRGVFRGGAG